MPFSVLPLIVFVEFPRQQVKVVYSCVALLEPAPILLMSSGEAQLFPRLWRLVFSASAHFVLYNLIQFIQKLPPVNDLVIQFTPVS